MAHLQRDDRLRYLETYILSKSGSIDRKNQVEVEEFNKLLSEYRDLIFFADTKHLNKQFGSSKKLEKSLKNFSTFFKKAPDQKATKQKVGILKTKIGKSLNLKKTQLSGSIHDIYNQLKKDS